MPLLFPWQKCAIRYKKNITHSKKPCVSARTTQIKGIYAKLFTHLKSKHMEIEMKVNLTHPLKNS